MFVRMETKEERDGMHTSYRIHQTRVPWRRGGSKRACDGEAMVYWRWRHLGHRDQVCSLRSLLVVSILRTVHSTVDVTIKI